MKTNLFRALSVCALLVSSTAFVQAQCNLNSSLTLVSGYSIQAQATGITQAAGSYAISWDWGDGSLPTQVFSPIVNHSYASAGTYQVCFTYLDAFGCLQENVCNSITLAAPTIPLCGLNCTYSLSGATLTVNCTGSGATQNPGFVFVPDLWYTFNNPFDFSVFQFATGNSATFTKTYNNSGNQSYTFAVAYADDVEDPQVPSCTENEFYGTITFGNPVGIEAPKLSAIDIYPVPASDILKISGEDVALLNQYVITDALGREIMRGTISETQTLDISSLSNGSYILYLSGNEKMAVKQFMISQ